MTCIKRKYRAYFKYDHLSSRRRRLFNFLSVERIKKKTSEVGEKNRKEEKQSVGVGVGGGKRRKPGIERRRRRGERERDKEKRRREKTSKFFPLHPPRSITLYIFTPIMRVYFYNRQKSYNRFDGSINNQSLPSIALIFYKKSSVKCAPLNGQLL